MDNPRQYLFFSLFITHQQPCQFRFLRLHRDLTYTTPTATCDSPSDPRGLKDSIYCGTCPYRTPHRYHTVQCVADEFSLALQQQLFTVLHQDVYYNTTVPWQ